MQATYAGSNTLRSYRSGKSTSGSNFLEEGEHCRCVLSDKSISTLQTLHKYLAQSNRFGSNSLGVKMRPVSYTHLTLPTKRIV